MIIEGTYTLQVPPEAVGRCLMDEQVLRRAIPGVERLEKLDERSMRIAVHIDQEPPLGSFNGKITVTEQQYPYSYALAYEGVGTQTPYRGEGVVHLSGRGENTVVAYKGTLNAGKTRSLQHPALVKGTAKHLLQQFFTALAEILRTTQPVSPASPASIDMVEYLQDTTTFEQSGEPMTPHPSAVRPTLLHSLVHRLGLGDSDPFLEELWVNRLKLWGTIGGFLLLVWIGTRLPRRASH